MKLRQRTKNIINAIRGKQFDWNAAFPGIYNNSNPTISQENSYSKVTTIYRCVDIISTAIADVPLYIYRDSKDGPLLIEDIGNRAYKLLERPNVMMTRTELLEQTIGWMQLRGMAYWWRQDRGTPQETIWILPSNFVNPSSYVKYPPDYYTYTNLGAPIKIPREDMVVFKKWNPNSFFDGVAPAEVGNMSASLNKKVIEMTKKFADDGFIQQGVFVKPDSMSDVQFKETLARLQEQFGRGAAHAFGVGLLTGVTDYKKIGILPSEAQAIETQKMTVEEISRPFGVPPGLVNDLEHANYSNLKEQTKILWLYKCKPEATRLANAITIFFLSQFDPNLYCEFDLATVPAIQEIQAEKDLADKQLVDSGLLSRNEFRSDRGRPDLVTGGDVYYLPISMVPVGTFAEEQVEGKSLEVRDKALELIFKKSDIPVIATETKEVKRRAFSSRKILTEEERIKHWKRFDLTLGSWEKKFGSTMRSYFKDQGKKVNRALSGHEGDLKDFVPFDKDKENSILLKATRPLYLECIRQAGQIAYIDLFNNKATPMFDLGLANVIDFINNQVGKRIVEINNYTMGLIRMDIAEGVNLGESLIDIERRIADIYSQAIDFRSERIARTETLSAHNFGDIEAYRQSDVVDGKEWLAIKDDRVRDEHLQADGQVVGLEDDFTIGNEKLEYPGDPSGSAEEVINCRCTTLPVLKE